MIIRLLLCLVSFGTLYCQDSSSWTIQDASLMTKNYTEPEQHHAVVAVVKVTSEFNFDKTVSKLLELEENKDIQGILFVIDSFGGRMSLHSVIHDMIKAISLEKPTVALIAGAAVSGGYLMASATNYVIAHSFSEIGSIGIVCEYTRYYNPQVMDQGVQANMIKQVVGIGKYKLMDHPFSAEMNEEQMQYAYSKAQQVYDHFVKTVADNRNILVQKASDWADGQFFLSSEALKLGLIDEIGTFFTAKTKLLELINSRNHIQAPKKRLILLFDQE